MSISDAPANTQAIVHLDRLRHNVAIVRDAMPGLDLMGVVKANAYGHGAKEIARELVDLGAPHLGVATVPEAISLRKAGIEASIMVFAPIREDWVAAATEWCLDVIVDGPESLSAAKQTTGRLRCHLKVDTGMGRLGRSPSESVAVLRGIELASNLDLGSVWTHFARADEPDSDFTDRQLDAFEAFIDDLGGAPAPLHVAASAAVFAHPRSVDASKYGVARVGIALYGLLDLPSEFRQGEYRPGGDRPGFGLRPVMDVVSRVTSLKRVPAGTPISYGSRWSAPTDTWIATVGAGYADGVSRLLTNRGEVRIGARRFPIAGTVCMDMFMIDIGPDRGDVRVGDPVLLFGEDGPTAFEIADLTDSITYVPVCAVSERVARIHQAG